MTSVRSTPMAYIHHCKKRIAAKPRMLAASLASVLLAACLVGTWGCGPTVYISRVTLKASASVEAAKAAKADEYSPYWYTLAVEYLHKAREEAAYADFQAANRFGRIAHEAALNAKEEAIARAKEGVPAAAKAPAEPAADDTAGAKGKTGGEGNANADK